MPPKRKNQRDLHTYIDESDYQLLKAIAGIRGTSLNALAQEAIADYLEAEDQQETIKTYNLERLIEPKE